MSVTIRLRRMGAKKAPFYRIVVLDSRKRRDGEYIESVGQYDPSQGEKPLNVNRERVNHWLSVGATMSDTVRNLLRKEGASSGN